MKLAAFVTLISLAFAIPADITMYEGTMDRVDGKNGDSKEKPKEAAPPNDSNGKPNGNLPTGDFKDMPKDAIPTGDFEEMLKNAFPDGDTNGKPKVDATGLAKDITSCVLETLAKHGLSDKQPDAPQK